MAHLEEITVGCQLNGIAARETVTVIAVQWYGNAALEVTFKNSRGQLGSQILYRGDEATVDVLGDSLPWSFGADADKMRLVSEAYRIHLAHLFDPYLAVHTSAIQPLPHQITAVYQEMLPRLPLRYILADDPGAGKTIMTGLFIKELIARGDLKRCLIVTPGNLAEQWQDELFRKFHLRFEVLTNDRIESAVSGNIFTEMNFCIARLDKLSRSEALQEKLRITDWDLIVCDEAHKMSATVWGGEIKYTKRFNLGRLLSEITRNFLLLTATPHNGKNEDFQLFLSLVDPDRFEGAARSSNQSIDVSDVMRRLVKEELLKFDGTPLFPERRAYTVNYDLSPAEGQLYSEVTSYVQEEFNRAENLNNDRKDPETRDRVCTQFSQLYQTNPSDFPPEVKEVEYRDRMISCYPIHPEIFDRLYDDWSTLERFQRTRGVLRLMAAVIHELWMGSDASAMIMPGSLSLDVPNVRDELIRYLPEGWNSIVNTEIDGKNSVPYQKDQSNQRYGRIMASRRVARTIMLGSAPTVRSQAVRGIEASRIRLGVVQPGENIADFNDALNTLRGSLAYLYTNTNGDRYWFDTRPTLRKTAQDRATQVAEADVIEEIESRLKKLRREEPFAGLHVCPASSLDVPDEQAARLVILRTEDTHRANAGASAAITAAENILNNHGSKPRTYRNMLTFVAPDQEAMLSLRQAVRDFRAWRSIQDDRETLNLDAAQNKEVDANLHRCNDTVEARIKETYCWLLIPEIDCFVDMKTIQWDASRISGGTDSIVAKASRKMQQSETLITKWAPALLLMELNNVLWKDTDCIQIKKLWEYLCTYCYLPRLAKYSVLEDAIRTGLNSQEYFALAAGYTGDRYVELRYNQFVDCINTSDLLVKLDPARKQLLAEKSAPAVVVQPTQTAQGGEQPTLFNLPPDAPIDPTVTLHQPPTAQPAAVPAPPKNTRFYMTAELDTTRINRDVQRLVEEVITHLLSADGCKVSVTLDVTADAPNGLSTPIVRTVMENCKTLKVKDFGVDE